MPQKFIVGNWKMHTTSSEADRLARGIVEGMGIEDQVSVAVCPPFPYLSLVGKILEGSSVALGALGHQATPEQAESAHDLIRKCFERRFGQASAQALVIQYGGSVKPDNAEALLGRDGVDGALIGGASLEAEPFLAIARAGIEMAHVSHSSNSTLLPQGSDK